MNDHISEVTRTGCVCEWRWYAAAIFPKLLFIIIFYDCILFCYFGIAQPWMLNSAATWELFMTSGGFFMHKLFFCHIAHFCSSPESPNIEGQQHFGQKSPKLFTWHHLWGETVPIWAGGTANINIWAHPLPSNICIFVFFTINFAFLAAYGLSLALEQFQPRSGLFAGDFLPRLVKSLLEKEVLE